MARIDYFDDPNAPKANSVVPSVTAVALNEAGEVLLIHRTDNDLWALPGGGVAVYGKRGQPCPRCGTPIQREKQGEDPRVTYWCPQCQPPIVEA